MRRIITGIVVLVSLAFLVTGCALVEDLARDTPGETRTKKEAAIRSWMRQYRSADATELGRTVGETEARARFDRMPLPDGWAIRQEAIVRVRRSDPSFDYAYIRGFVEGWRIVGNARYPNDNPEAKLAERDFQERRPFTLPLPTDSSRTLWSGYTYGWNRAENWARITGTYGPGGFDPNYTIGGGGGGGDGGG